MKTKHKYQAVINCIKHTVLEVHEPGQLTLAVIDQLRGRLWWKDLPDSWSSDQVLWAVKNNIRSMVNG